MKGKEISLEIRNIEKLGDKKLTKKNIEENVKHAFDGNTGVDKTPAHSAMGEHKRT
jgi:hypothetical protein